MSWQEGCDLWASDLGAVRANPELKNFRAYVYRRRDRWSNCLGDFFTLEEAQQAIELAAIEGALAEEGD